MIIVASEVVIGFLNTSYTVDENDGLVNIQIGIINFTVLSTSLVVNFSISQNQPDRGKPNLCKGRFTMWHKPFVALICECKLKILVIFLRSDTRTQCKGTQG